MNSTVLHWLDAFNEGKKRRGPKTENSQSPSLAGHQVFLRTQPQQAQVQLPSQAA